MDPSLIWLVASLFTWGIGEGMFLIFQPLYLQQLGANPIAIGSIIGAAGFAMVVAHIPAGHLADRVGRRPILLAAWTVGTLAAWTMALAPGLSLFVAGVILYGATAFVISPMNSYATAARGNWTVGRVLTFTSGMYNVGVVIGPLLGGWLGDRFGLRSVYFASGTIFLVSTILLSLIRPQPRDHHDPSNPPGGLLSNWRYLSLLTVLFVTAFAMYLPQPLTPNFLQNERGMSLSTIGRLASIGGLGNALLAFFIGNLEARLGFILGQVGVALFSFLLWRTTGFGWYALAYFLLGGYRAARALGAAQIRPLVHESQMGLAYGISETVVALTILAAPPLAGFLYDRDPASVYPLGLFLIALGVLISLIFMPRTKRKTLSPEPVEIASDT